MIIHIKTDSLDMISCINQSPFDHHYTLTHTQRIDSDAK